LAYDSVGYLYIVDSDNNRIVLASGSTVVGTSGSAGTALGQFQGAVNVAVGSRGIYVADTANNRVQFFNPLPSGHGAVLTPFNPRGALVAGQFTPALSQPSAAALSADLLEEKAYIADTGNNRVVCVRLPAGDNPDTVWSQMKAQLVAGNVSAAIPFFCISSRDRYREAFSSIGTTELASLISSIPTPLIPIFIDGDIAQYRFEQVIEGRTLSFPVDFVKENGTWKIVEF
jgi:DNA-binding beta-propeller fold protein YncE